MTLNATTSRERRTASAGFTLAEILVSMLIIGIVGVSLYAGLAQTFRSLKSARHKLRATQILAEKLEVIRLYNWDQVNTPGFVPTSFTEYEHPGITNSGDIVYSGTVTISSAPVQPAYTNTMRKAVVQISWVSGGVAQQQTMETLVSEHGVQNYIY